MTTQDLVKTPRKLIEVALPLNAINAESLRRKQKAPKGWPTSFHKWWAQRPLAAARAVIFAQLVNDPSWKWELEHTDDTPPNNLKASWAASRKRLFTLLEELVLWENSDNDEVLARARAEIMKSWRDTCELNKDHPRAAELFSPTTLPPLCDPFAGSGTIPLEGQRLGISVLAGDLNPVAVLINKALMEIPRAFSGRPPVNPVTTADKSLVPRQWTSARGLADDVRYYGQWMLDEATKRIGNLYPPMHVTPEVAKRRPDLKPLIGQQLTVIAWLWARTVKSPNPAFRHIDVPLASTFILSSKEGREAYVQPIKENGDYRFEVRMGTPPPDAKAGTTAGKRAGFRCLMSGVPIDYTYIRSEGKAGRMRQKLMAIVAEGPRGRVYIPPLHDVEVLGLRPTPSWIPDLALPTNPRDFKPPNYGLTTFGALFTPRQLVALATFGDIVLDAHEKVRADAMDRGMSHDTQRFANGGTGSTAYADAICTYLACILDRMVYYGSSLTTWLPKDNALRDCMPRQALAMAWDFAEANPLGKSSGDVLTCTASVANYLDVATPFASVSVEQADAAALSQQQSAVLFSTDPPYYDNIGYADLSDYFYVWLRRSLRGIYPELFATLSTPKSEELVATPYRHGTKDNAEKFFLTGMTKVMTQMVARAHPAFPVTVYYAFKQTEDDNESGISSTGWETFLDAMLDSGFSITGTWPLRTEGAGRMLAKDTNALASSIIMVCRPRPSDAATISRREFLRELNTVLPVALDEMTRGAGDDQLPLAPVDLSQAMIGPGMAVYSRYAAVLEADGKPMSVRTALQLINRFLAEDDFDHDTQFCLHWFEQHGWADGKFGDADTLARAKGTSVDGVKHAGVLFAAGEVVRLFKWSEYPTDWDPATDPRLPIWEALHQLIRVFKMDGESSAGAVLAIVQEKAEAIRQLGYRLHTLSERAGRADDARAYNEIITSWTAIESAAAATPAPKQATLFG